jgi:class 3 adenylate cyclase/tetratricopeptide (TPR) repeat protein
MHCGNCGASLGAAARFCHQCGTAIGRSCPRCQASLEAAFRFCPECGLDLQGRDSGVRDLPEPPTDLRPGHQVLFPPPNPVAMPAPSDALAAMGTAVNLGGGERKIVTVMFCDLVGSTQIAEQMDPEEYRDLLDAYLKLAIDRIAAMDGVVNQLAGDGFMALFGAPTALEDEPGRATEAALNIQGALVEYNRENSERGIELRARIGIHTGPVVVGNVGTDLKTDYTAIGDTTNLASRLQTLAQPGCILISDAMRRLVEGRFKLHKAGPFDVAGKSEPVEAFEVERKFSGVTPIALARARGLTPLVGFQGELEQLEACFDRLDRGYAQIVSVVGETGSGKSRLIHEFKRRLTTRNVLVIEARCSSLTRNVPFVTVSSILKQMFQIGPSESAESAKAKVAHQLASLEGSTEDLLPGLVSLAIGENEVADREPEGGQRERGVRAVGELLERLSQRKPLVMILENLHWLDDASRELIGLCVSGLYRASVMILLTHRPDFSVNWRSSSALTRLRLQPFGPEEAAQIVRARAGGRLPQELEQRIVERADGNPFFLEEITRGLLEQGYIVQEDEELRLTRPVDEIEIPATVQEVIEARLDRLSPAAKRTAQIASVFGRQVRVDQLAALLQPEGIDAELELRELEERDIIRRETGPTGQDYRFGESLTLTVAYGGLLLKERRQLHERIGNLLERAPDTGAGERSGVVAQHLARGEDRAKAVESLLRAAREAEEMPSYSSALELYRGAWRVGEEALAAGGPETETIQRAVLEATHGICRVAVLYSSPGGSDEQAALRGEELARELGDVETLAGMYSLHGMLLGGGDHERFHEGIALIEQGMAIAEEAGLSMAAISIKRGLAWASLLDGQFTRAAQLAAEVLEALAAAGHAEIQSDAWVGVHFLGARVLLHSDDLEGALRRGHEAHELAVEAANRTLQSATAGMLAQAHYLAGKYVAARDWADRAAEVGRSIGNVGSIRTGMTLGLIARLELGQHGPTGPFLEVVDQSLDSPSDLTSNADLIVDALIRSGETERAEQYAARTVRHGGGRLRALLGALAMGQVKRQLGAPHWRESEECYDRALRLARELGLRSVEAAALLGRGALALEMDDLAHAETLIASARELAQQSGFLCYRDQADRLLAVTQRPPRET